MAREEFRGVELNTPLRPQAAPVDTFVVAPQVSGDTSLGQLARSLSNVSGEMSAFLAERKQREEKEQAILSEADFYRNNRVGFAEAVQKGLIPPQASRAYVERWKALEGDNAGARIQAQFDSAYNQWDKRHTATPEEFDGFLSDFVQRNVGSTDPQVLQGLLPRLRLLAQNAQTKHVATVAEHTRSSAERAAAANVDNTLTEHARESIANRRPPNWGETIKRIEKAREEALAAGMNPEAFDKNTIDAVAARAVDLRGAEGLRLLNTFMDSKVPGKDYTWGSTPEGRKARTQAENTIEVEARRSVAENRQESEARRKAEVDSITRRTVEAIAANPTAPIPEALIREGSKVDPDFRVKAVGWQRTLTQTGAVSDPRVMVELMDEIYRGGGTDVLRRALDNDLVRTPEDFNRLLDLQRKLEDKTNPIRAILSSGAATETLTAIRERTGSSQSNLDPMGGLARTDATLQAQTDFRMLLLDWAQRNPNASLLEQEKAIAEMRKIILDRITPGQLGVDPTYNGLQATPARPDAAGPTAVPPTPGASVRPNRAPAPQPQPQAQPQAQPRQTQVPQVDDQTVTDWFASLPPEVRQAARSRYNPNSGRTYMDFLREAYGTAQRQQQQQQPQPQSPVPGGERRTEANPEGLPIQPAAFTQGQPDGQSVVDAVNQAVSAAFDDSADPQGVYRQVYNIIGEAIAGRANRPAPKNFATAVVREDETAARVLDFIAGPESRGNYNAYFGNANSTKDLSRMTFDQVFNWARQRQRNGGVSSATGRYQFMFETAMGRNGQGGLKQRMGLTGNELFTPELQDRMAMQLMEDAGYSRWREGRMTDEAFGQRLAGIWAGLPDMRSGRSVYYRDGVNKALVSPRQVLASLQDARTAGSDARPERVVEGDVSPAYALIPERDARGRDQRRQFMEWNPDPVGNHETYLRQVRPELQDVVRLAQQKLPEGVRFVVGSGVRSRELQQRAIEWGWSKTEDSRHLHGEAVDLWPIDRQGRVNFTRAEQIAIGRAIEQAAEELGVGIRWGKNFRGFEDLPHFELERRSTNRRQRKDTNA